MNRPRIGLVTFHRPMSHGARLQAFALQEAIKKNGCECQILDYAPPAPSSSAPGFTRRLYAGAANLVFGKRIRTLNQRFGAWSAERFSLTAPLLSEEELQETAEQFDAFVCGSDQIWKDPKQGFYYLNFTKKPRIAYAPSFGNTLGAENAKEAVRQNLEGFSALSVREKDGAEFLSGLMQKPVESVLDPTLLWGPEFWRKYAADPKTRLPKRFLLLFTIQDTIPSFNAAQQICKRLGLTPVVVDTARRLIWHPFLKNLFYVGPAEFLRLIDLADFIVTSSFHGTVFAVNFGKPFLTICRKEDGNVNARILSIADTLDTRDRLAVAGEEVPDSALAQLSPEVCKRLSAERERSLAFLAKSLENQRIRS